MHMLSFHDNEIMPENMAANEDLGKVDQSQVYIQSNPLHFICTDNRYKDLITV